MARTPIHPGEHLAEELKELNIYAAELARQIRRASESHHWDHQWSTCDHGRYGAAARPLVGTSPEFWLNLQKLYELRLAREEVGDRVERLPKLAERKRKKENGAPRMF